MATNDDVQAEVKRLKDDLGKLRGDVSSLVDVLRELGIEKANATKESLTEEMQKRREKVREAINKARTVGESQIDDIEENITSHPLSSLAMAFGIGFIIAKLLDGGRH